MQVSTARGQDMATGICSWWTSHDISQMSMCNNCNHQVVAHGIAKQPGRTEIGNTACLCASIIETQAQPSIHLINADSCPLHLHEAVMCLLLMRLKHVQLLAHSTLLAGYLQWCIATHYLLILAVLATPQHACSARTCSITARINT